MTFAGLPGEGRTGAVRLQRAPRRSKVLRCSVSLAVEEVTLGGWLVVMGDSVRCYGGRPIVLRLWVSFLLCWSTQCIGFGVVPVVRLVLRTLATGCLVG